MSYLNSLPEIESIEISMPVHALLETSTTNIEAAKSWQHPDAVNSPFTGEGIIIGIIDTGVDYTHQDFGACTAINSGGNCRVIGGYDFVNDDPDPIDDAFHGTHVAGIAAGNGRLMGVAPKASLYAYKVLNSQGIGYSDNVIAAIDASIDPNNDDDFSDHLDVISLSLGGPGNPDDAQSTAIDNAVNIGVVAVIAAGNSGPLPQTIRSPGTARNAITVGASCQPAQIGVNSYCNDSIASFSSRGPIIWNNETILKPEIVAPGVSICSSQLGDFLQERECVDDKHITLSGTSMATPHVAGTAALLLQKNPSLTPAQVKQSLQDFAVPFGDATVDEQGSGLIKVYPMLDIQPAFHSVEPNIILSIAPSNSINNASSFFTLTPDSGSQTVQLTASLPSGISGNFSQSQINLTNPQQITLNLSVDNLVVAGGKVHYASILAQSAGYHIVLPLNIVVGDRVSINPNSIDFDVFPPNNSSWASSKQITIINNISNLSQQFTLTTNCCQKFDANERFQQNIWPAGLTFNVPSTVSLAGGASNVFTFAAQANTSIPNAIYKGEFVLSSPLQEFRIPFKITKFYSLNMTFDAQPEFVIVYQGNTGTNYVGSRYFPEGSGTAYISSPTEADILVTTSISSNPNIAAFNFRENVDLSSGSANEVINNSQHVFDFSFNFKDKNNNPITPNTMVLTLHKESAGFYFGSGGTAEFWVDNASTDFRFDWGAMYFTNEKSTYNFSGFKRGINSNTIISNSPLDLETIAVKPKSAINPSAKFGRNVFAKGLGVYMDSGFTPSQIPNHTLYQQNADSGARAGINFSYYTDFGDPSINDLRSFDIITQANDSFNAYNDSDGDFIKLSGIGNQRFIGLMPMIWIGKGKLEFPQSSSASINFDTPNAIQFYSFVSQSMDYFHSEPSPYTVFRNGLQSGNGTLFGGTLTIPAFNDIDVPLGSSDADYLIQISKQYSIDGVNYNAVAEISGQALRGMQPKPFPSMNSLELFSSDWQNNFFQTDRVDLTKQNKLKATFDYSSTGPLEFAYLEAFDGTSWIQQNATLDLANGTFESIIAVPNSGNILKLRLTAFTTDIVTLTYTFEVPIINVPTASSLSYIKVDDYHFIIVASRNLNLNVNPEQNIKLFSENGQEQLQTAVDPLPSQYSSWSGKAIAWHHEEQGYGDYYALFTGIKDSQQIVFPDSGARFTIR